MDFNCPYCDADVTINHDDGFGYEENTKHQMECPKCDKKFVFETTVVFYYEPEKADCLNDGNHDYSLNHAFPIEFSQMECSMCGDVREMTDNERAKFNIGTKQSYFKSQK